MAPKEARTTAREDGALYSLKRRSPWAVSVETF